MYPPNIEVVFSKSSAHLELSKPKLHSAKSTVLPIIHPTPWTVLPTSAEVKPRLKAFNPLLSSTLRGPMYVLS